MIFPRGRSSLSEVSYGKDLRFLTMNVKQGLGYGGFSLSISLILFILVTIMKETHHFTRFIM